MVQARSPGATVPDVSLLKTLLPDHLRRPRELEDEIDWSVCEPRTLDRFGPLVGASPAIGKVYDLISRVASTDATVWIIGKSGTGKELVAQTVHQLSRRKMGPFLPLNCAAIAPDLIESELFGHERGSFTGAHCQHKGFFERASAGTLFLDEITEMPLALQVKLLRVLETDTVTRLGGERPLAVDVRVVVASNRRPEDAMRDAKLRADLLYRLKVFPIHLPSLCDRGPEDIELLANHFLQEVNQREGTAKQFTAAAKARLHQHHWPGNAREMKNAVHRAFILADAKITPDCLPGIGESPEVSETTSPAGAGPLLHIPVGTTVAEAARRLTLATLNQCHGDKHRCAMVLGISLKTLYNRLNAYKASPPLAERLPNILGESRPAVSGEAADARPRNAVRSRRAA